MLKQIKAVLSDNKGYTLMELLICIFGGMVVIGAIALLVVVVKVAWHFIAKFW